MNPDEIRRWSIEEAKARDEAARNEADLPDSKAPMMQWSAVMQIDDLEGEFCAGKKLALFQAIRLCAAHGLAMPEWVAAGFIAGFDRVATLKARSWDEAFGQPLRKGLHLADARIRRRRGPAVFLEVERLRAAGADVDDQLFEQVGRDLGVGKTLANKLYYQWQRRVSPRSEPKS